MSHPPSEHSFSAPSEPIDPAIGGPGMDALSDRHRAALGALDRASEARRPLTVFICDGRFEASHVIRVFLESMEADAAVVRLTEPFHAAIDAMREIITAIGFEPKKLGLKDLDGIFEMFLSYQKKHHRRTVLSIEQAHVQDSWLLDYLRQLIEREESERYGLMVLLAGRPQLLELFDEEPLSALRETAKRPITLAPFTLAETTEFLRQRARATGKDDVSQLFDFDAIGQIHELSAGVPDSVGALCLKSLQLARQQGIKPVTENLVLDAGRLLGQAPKAETEDSIFDFPGFETTPRSELPDFETTSPSTADTVSLSMSDSSCPDRLVVTRRGKRLQDFELQPGRYMVGRAETSDLWLNSNQVSRRHALIIKSASEVTLLDLGSTNGTYVNGQRFEGDRHIRIGDVITVGDCRMECRADN